MVNYSCIGMEISILRSGSSGVVILYRDERTPCLFETEQISIPAQVPGKER